MPTGEQSQGRQSALVASLGVCLAGVVALTAFVASHLGGDSIDHSVWRWMVDNRDHPAITFFRNISHVGDPMVLLAGAVIAGLLLLRHRSVVTAAAPMVALLGAAATEFVVKIVIGRSRPPAFARLLHETDQSFPSGHTTGTAALLMVIALLVAPTLTRRSARVAIVVGAGLAAAFIGLARMVLGVHWFTDVAAGWMLGTAWASAVVLMLPWAERWWSDHGPELPVLGRFQGRHHVASS